MAADHRKGGRLQNFTGASSGGAADPDGVDAAGACLLGV